MNDQNKNLILATVLSFLVITAWMFLFPPTEVATNTAQTPPAGNLSLPNGTDLGSSPPAAAPSGHPTGETQAPVAPKAITETPRIAIDTPELEGSISLRGGRIDELRLKLYHETIEPNSPIVTLLRPEGDPEAYYAAYGWSATRELALEDVPNANTLWEVVGNPTLTPETPVTLRWTSPAGLIFTRKIAVDPQYMFTVTQSVENTGDTPRRLAPYGVIMRHSEPKDLKQFFILHEGALLQTGKELDEINYKDIRGFETNPVWGAHAKSVPVESNGWLGFTDHYWMTTLIPASDQPFDAVIKYYQTVDTYSAWSQLPLVEVAPGQSASVETRLFAGAKEWETIRHYQRESGVYNFIDSIDWGWFFFLTKPMFWLLHNLNKLIGNMGWAIIALTFFVKAVMFPIARRSYISMAKMKELQPEIEKLKERAGDDRAKLQKEMMELYRKEKVNPAAGCLPIFLQIPVFFSLYKVIFVTLELRHAPWILWIRDLSAPDPTSILNLFGLLPFDPSALPPFLQIFSIGVLPILLGISMWLQQKLNPAPTDATQATIMAWMPWVFMFMLGRFASGLVLYWITSNTLTFLQQYLIMRAHGHKPDVFGNIISSFRRKPKEPK